MANEIVKKVNGLVSDLDGSITEIAEGLKTEKENIHEKLEGYRIGILPAETDDETEKAWASDRIALNKERLNYDSIRKDLMKNWKNKVNPIIDQLKSIDGEFNLAIGNIDDQLSGLEEKRKIEKEKAIRALYLSEIPADFRERVSFERIMSMRDASIKQIKTYSETLYNKGYTITKIQNLFRSMGQDWQMAVNTIRGLNHKFEWDGLERFWETLDMNAAISYMGEKQKQFEEYERREAARIEYEKQQAARRAQEEAERQARIKEAQTRQEEERKRREEEARIRAEEQAKAAEERRKQTEEDEKRRQAAVEVARAEERKKAAEAFSMEEPEPEPEPVKEEDPKTSSWGEWGDTGSWGEWTEPKTKYFKYVVEIPQDKLETFQNIMKDSGIEITFIGEEEK